MHTVLWQSLLLLHGHDLCELSHVREKHHHRETAGLAEAGRFHLQWSMYSDCNNALQASLKGKKSNKCNGLFHTNLVRQGRMDPSEPEHLTAQS